MHVAASLLTWAVERSGLQQAEVTAKFPRFDDWLQDGSRPLLADLEKFAKLTRTPLGYLFLDEPPEESVPIKDFRTWGNAPVGRPSADLLEIIYLSQARQAWYREYAKRIGQDRLPFVGSVSPDSPPGPVAVHICQVLGFDAKRRRTWGKPDDAWRWLFGAVESLGVLVMANGVVGGNTHRKLDPKEFRGFSISDDLAPLIFVNLADGKPSKAPLVFTLIHELAHVWAGDSVLSSADPSASRGSAGELWANRVAAEALVPKGELASAWAGSSAADLQRLRRVFHVSTLVILRKALDDGLLGRDEYQRACNAERARLDAHDASGSAGGGNFYNVAPYRVGRGFAKAVIADTLEGGTLFSEAYSLLGVSSHRTFERLAEKVMA
jgi:Zn-dependent peptidase ImmA (M78 family)